MASHRQRARKQQRRHQHMLYTQVEHGEILPAVSDLLDPLANAKAAAEVVNRDRAERITRHARRLLTKP